MPKGGDYRALARSMHKQGRATRNGWKSCNPTSRCANDLSKFVLSVLATCTVELNDTQLVAIHGIITNALS